MEEKVKESDKALLSKKIAELKRQYEHFGKALAVAEEGLDELLIKEVRPSHPDGYYLPKDGERYFSTYDSASIIWEADDVSNSDLYSDVSCKTEEEKDRVEAQKVAYKKMVLAIHEENLRTGFVVDLKDDEQTVCYFGINRTHNAVSIHKDCICIPCHPRECFSVESDMKLKFLLGAETIKIAKGWN